VFNSKLNKTMISVTLAFVILTSALAASYVITPAKAQPYFTLWAVLNTDPYYGYYGGYHDVFYKLQIELAKIDIDLQIHILPDLYSLWELMWSPSVPEGGQVGGHPPQGGWDITAMEWWMHNQGFLWMDAIILSQNVANGPKGGINIFPYLSYENDELYWKTQTTYDVATRKAYADEWQEYLMHNPPIINMWYPNTYDVRGKYIEGYDGNAWFYDLNNMYLNPATVATYASQLGPTAVTRLGTDKSIVYAAGEEWWNFLVTYCDSYTEEQFQNMVSGTLYRPSIDPWPAEGVNPPPTDYTVRPHLASGMPIDIGWETNVTLNDEYRVRIPLREGVVWSDDDPFDAEDVVWTINELILDPTIGCTGTGDFAPMVQYATYKNDIPPGVGGYDPYAVDLILYEPYVDLPLILGNSWGSGILPKHFFEAHGGPPAKTSAYNSGFNQAKDVPCIGPFKFLDEVPPIGAGALTFANNTKYFGYALGWGPHGIDEVVLDYIEDPGTVMSKLRTHEIDFGEYPTAPITAFEALRNDPSFLVQISSYPASNPIWMNFNNPNLSNRYVRLALAHAIPYEDIFKNTLPGWGIVDPIPGGTWVHPWQVYQGEFLFNTEMGKYEYDLTKAQQYLDMYLYSQQAYAPQGSPEVALGPVGDANFDGKVNLDDLLYWLEESGNAPLTRQLDAEPWWDPSWLSGPYDTIFPRDGGPVAPGHDIDPDFDNSGTVGSEDLALWIANFGNQYPYDGAW